VGAAATTAVAALAAADATIHSASAHDGAHLSAAVALGRVLEHTAALLPGSTALSARLPLVLACAAAALFLYLAVLGTYGRVAASLAALGPALAPLPAVAVRDADPAALILAAASAGVWLSLAAARRPRSWRTPLAALAIAAALLPLFGPAAAAPGQAHAAGPLLGLVQMPSLLVPGSLLGGALLLCRLPRPSARFRQAVIALAWLSAALALLVIDRNMAWQAALFALPAAAVLFAATAATLMRALGRRSRWRYALAAWVAATAAAEFAFTASGGDPLLPAAVLAVAIGAAIALGLGRTPPFASSARVSQLVPILLAMAGVLALPAVGTVQAAAPRLQFSRLGADARLHLAPNGEPPGFYHRH
jgi:4-amino-4-deoxy-L-arabinose transferase-like glycosyltransferase